MSDELATLDATAQAELITAGSNLIATRRRSLSWTASYTTPMPPRPMMPLIS